MIMFSQSLERARKGMDFYGGEVESWRSDHHEAMNCLELEQAISLGIYAFKLVLKADREHRLAAFEGRVKFNESWEKNVFEMVRDWSESTEQFMAAVKHFELKGFDVSGSSELRSLLSQAVDILTADGDFFQEQKLGNLKKRAIKANRSGQTEDLL